MDQLESGAHVKWRQYGAQVEDSGVEQGSGEPQFSDGVLAVA